LITARPWRLAEPAALVLLLAGLALAGIIGFLIGSSRVPSAVLVPGRPTTLHVYRFDPAGSLPQPGNGERVIFDQSAIASVATELNRLPPFPRFGRHCDVSLPTYQLSFDYNNGDQLTVEVRPSPCGMVTGLGGDDTTRGDALNSPLFDQLATFLKPRSP